MSRAMSMGRVRRGTLFTHGSAAPVEIVTVESPEEKTKRQFDFMTSDVLKERQKNTLAATYYKARGNHVFLLSALITLIQAGLASTASLFSELIQSKITITIALLASFSVFWQSFVKHWDYGGKATLHESAASALEKIYNVALLRSRDESANWYATADVGVGGMEIGASPAENDAEESAKVEEGAITTTDAKPNANNEEDKDGRGASNQLKTLTKQFEQAIEGCSQQVPVQIAAAFAFLEMRIGMCKRDVVFDKDDEKASTRVRWEKVFPAMYQTLTTTIISSPGWPYFLPDPEKVVDKAMEKFQNLDAKLLESLLERNKKIGEHYGSFENNFA